MKASEIRVGGVYLAKVSGKVVPVRVLSIEDTDTMRVNPMPGKRESRPAVRYYVLNKVTGRRTVFRSAAKFRSEVKSKQDGGSTADVLSAPVVQPTLEGKQSADPISEQEERNLGGTQQPADTPISGTSTSSETTLVSPTTTNPTLLPAGVVAALVKLREKPSVPLPSTDSTPSISIYSGMTFNGRTPTDEQAEILEATRLSDRVLVIEAGAGTGKTTTLSMIEQVAQGNGQYTAFNKSLVEESRSKFKKAACNTTHSLAFRAVGKRYAHRLNSHRVRSYEIANRLGISEMTVGEKRLTPSNLAYNVTEAIRRYCQSADREISTCHFRYIDGIDPVIDGKRSFDNNESVREHLLPFARRVWDDLSDPQGQMPFQHDHYVKIWQLGQPFIAADYILLDEAQDTAPVMLDILKQQRCRIILVGDSAQQIYEWRGAVNAMTSFGDAPTRMLSQSFRFGPAIAEVANQILSGIPGIKLRLKGLSSIDSKVASVGQPSCVLCRTNAAAVGRLLQEVADGRSPHLIGGGGEVVRFVEAAVELQKTGSTNHPDISCFTSWRELVAYTKEDEGSDLRLMVKLVEDFGSEKILSALKRMPSERGADIVISTAHKSKGREWDSVQLAPDFPTKEDCGEEERKLLYVAVTRAKLTLDISRCPFFMEQEGPYEN